MEKMTKEYQVIEEQLQSLALQKEQFKELKDEVVAALAEVEKAKGKIFLAVGGVMVDVDKEIASKNLKERQDSAAMRLSIVDRQFDESRKKEQALRTELTNALKETGQQD